MRIRIKKGLNLQVGEQPGDGVAEVKTCSAAAVLGRDFPGVKFELLLEPGSPIQAGAPLLRDRHRPDIVFTAPMSGTVAGFRRGPRRTLLSAQISAGDKRVPAMQFQVPALLDNDSGRRLMLQSGLWTALRKRPFGHIPDQDAEPKALLVTAMDTEPLAPDAASTICAHADEFTSGLRLLLSICHAPVYVCQARGARLPVTESDRLQIAEFEGPHPAGLPGAHIFSLCPIGADGKEVWHIGYQDVIACGHVATLGRPWLQRVISLAGTAVKQPRLLTVPLAARVDDLVAGELIESEVRVIAGSALSGHLATGAEAYLGQRQNQVTALKATQFAGLGWRRNTGYETGTGEKAGPLIPTADLDRVAPPGILPIPMLRALLVGDIDRARALGALELVEEDLALLTYACSSNNNYGGLLREVLDQLHKEAT